MVVNIFYRTSTTRGLRVAHLDSTKANLLEFCRLIEKSDNIRLDDLLLCYGTRTFRPSNCNPESIPLDNNRTIDICIPTLGGKGGFGSLLRAIGAQIEKTTNRDACRDLSGRRIRDVKREEDLKKLIALQEKLQEERKRRKKEKLERLKKKLDSTASASIQELVNMFQDHEYNKRRLEIGDIIEAAVDKGIINFKKRQHDEPGDAEGELDTSVKRIKALESDIDSDRNHETDETNDHEQITTSNIKSYKDDSKIKKDQLWLGLESDED